MRVSPATGAVSVLEPGQGIMAQFDGLEVLQALALTQPLTAVDSPETPVHTKPVDHSSARGNSLSSLLRRVWAQRLRIALFAINGINVFAVGLLIQVLLVRYEGMGHVSSYIVQTVASVQMNFLLSRFLTWRDRDVHLIRALARFNVQQLAVTGLGMAGYAGLEQLGINYIGANVAVTALLTPVSFLSSHKWSMGERTHLRWRVASLPWPLFVVLIIQAGMSLRLVWSNTAFTDEALYIWAGHLQWAHWLNGLNITPLGFPDYFSGAPVIYPPLVAIFDSVGGLALARCLSLLFMMAATGFLWATTCRLYGRKAAFYGCALFTTVGTGQDLGAFATYDAMAIASLSLAMWLGIRGVCARGLPRVMLYASSGAALVFADAVKYASGLWNPVVILAVAAVAWQRGRAADGVRAASVMLMTWTAVIIPLLVVAGRDYWRGIMFTTVARQVGSATEDPQTVFWLGFTYVWILILLGCIALVVNLRSGRPTVLFFGVLLLGVLAAPINQARIESWASLYKHTAFGAWFGSIAAGYLIAAAVTINRRKGWRIGAAVVALAAVSGYGQGVAQFGYWPQVSLLMSAFHKDLTPTSGPVLADQASDIRYYLAQQVGFYQVTGISMAAVPEIRRHYFSYVEIDFSFTSIAVADRKAYQAVEATPGYHLVKVIPWSDYYHSGRCWIWKYEGSL
jgi:putative flippase GtrA